LTDTFPAGLYLQDNILSIVSSQAYSAVYRKEANSGVSCSFLANSAKSGSPTSVQCNFCLTESWCCK